MNFRPDNRLTAAGRDRRSVAAAPSAGDRWIGTRARSAAAAPSAGDRRGAFVALVAAGVLWGLTVPLSKLALEWLDAGWLTVLRFGLAAPLLLLATRRAHLRAALTPRVVAAGAIGFGLVIVLQNAGIARTNVSHASLIVGAVPVLVALIAFALRRGTAGPLGWAGHVLALAGVALVAGAGGAGSSLSGDAIVLVSVVLSAGFIVAQPGLLRGRDPVAVTAVQLTAGALAALPYAALAEGMPPAPGAEGPVLAAIGLAIAGTLLAFSLFAYGQARVPADVAGAFVNLEPLVGALAATLAFHEPFGGIQLAGAAAILAGLALGSLRLPGDRPPRAERRSAREARRAGSHMPAERAGARLRDRAAELPARVREHARPLEPPQPRRHWRRHPAGGLAAACDCC